MRDLWKNLALLVASVLVTLTVAELALRLVVGRRVERDELRAMLDRSAESLPEAGTRNVSLRGLVRASDNDRRVYELKPGLDAHFIGVPVRINQAGFRERELPRAKPAGTFRIVGLGDSDMFGWGVPAESTYLRQLEALIARRRQRVQVLNFAVPGYNAAMEVETYRSVAHAYQPDLVIVGYIGNDADVPNFMRGDLLEWPGTLYLYNLLVHGSAAMRHRARELMPVRWDQAEERLVAPRGVPERYRDMVGEGAVWRAYGELASLTAPAGIPVLVFGDAFRSLDAAQIARLERESCFEFLTEKRVRALYRRRHGIRPAPAELVLSESDPHASILAHRLRAEGIHHTLKRRRLLPRKKRGVDTREAPCAARTSGRPV